MKICPRCQTPYENAAFCTRDGSPLVDAAGPSSMQIGTVLDNRYRITAFLGAGGMGEVYRAEHIHIFKTVAIKLLKPEITGDADVLARFKREAMLASSIGHPSIVRIEDFGELPDGRVYMAMECLTGETMAAASSRQPVDVVRALGWMRDVALAMAAAHDKGIIHRDLKPENVFIARQDGQETVKIVDFGIAKMRAGMTISPAGRPHNADASTLTQEGHVFGTPYYMSPEQAMGMPVDARSDIYAMGVMLYELLSGKVPFSEGSFMKILFMHVNDPPPPLRDLAPAVPAFVEAIVNQALEKAPENRQSSARELARQLEDALHRLQTQKNAPYENPDAALRDTSSPPPPSGPTFARHEAPAILPANALPAFAGKSRGAASSAPDINNLPAPVEKSPVLLLRAGIHSAARRRRRRKLLVLVLLLAATALGTALIWMYAVRMQDDDSSLDSDPDPPHPPLAQREKPSAAPPKTFQYDCPSEMSPPMGFSPLSLGALQESRRKTLQIPCDGGRCRILASPAVVQNVLVAAASPGQVLAWKADTLEPLWHAPAGGDIVAPPLIWEGKVVTASKDKRIRIHALKNGNPLFESPPASEYFTAAPFVSRGRVLIPAWDHSFHLIEPFSPGSAVSYTARKIVVQGILIHTPTRVEGDRWFFAGTRILARKRGYHYNFYLPVDGETLSVQPENKVRLCVVNMDADAEPNISDLESCPPDTLLLEDLPTLSAYPPLVTPSWAWFFLYGGPDSAPDGIVVLCSRTESRCRRVLRAGTYGSPAAGRVNNRPFGVFAMYNHGKCELCGFFLDESAAAEENGLQCRWKTEIPGCPGDLRWMGDEIVFGTRSSRLLRVQAADGRILQETRLSGRVTAPVVRCADRLFVGTLDQTLDVFGLR